MVDVGADRLTVMLAGRPDKIDDFEGLLEPYGIVELQRTGRVALPKLDAATSTRLHRCATRSIETKERESDPWPPCTTSPTPTRS